MELMGIRQKLTSPYYCQRNGIVERSHWTIGNMIRAQLAHRGDKDWVDVLPGVMLMLNKMDQENHGYSASKIMLGQGMNLPADLLYTQGDSGRGDRSKYVKNLGKELREVRRRVTPFNQATRQPAANPFQEGDLTLIYQQPMEKTHKQSPRWRGPFRVTKIINSFQVTYEDQGKRKITHINNCKKYYDQLVDMGGEATPPSDLMLEVKKWAVRTNCQKPSSSRSKMSLSHFVVRVGDEMQSFDEPGHFLQWLGGEEGNSTDICIRGVPARGGTGSP